MNTVVFPDGALVTEYEADKPAISVMKGLRINLVVLPRDTLYMLQDGITTEVRAIESCTLQVINEKKFNMEQLSLECDEVVSQMQKLE